MDQGADGREGAASVVREFVLRLGKVHLFPQLAVLVPEQDLEGGRLARFQRRVVAIVPVISQDVARRVPDVNLHPGVHGLAAALVLNASRDAEHRHADVEVQALDQNDLGNRIRLAADGSPRHNHDKNRRGGDKDRSSHVSSRDIHEAYHRPGAFRSQGAGREAHIRQASSS